MKHIIIIFLTLIIGAYTAKDTNAQKKKVKYSKETDTHQYRNTKGIRYPIWYLPTRAHKIHGIAFGIVNPCQNHNFQSELTINGLSVEMVGQLPVIIEYLIWPNKRQVCHSNYCRVNGITAGLSIGNGLVNGLAFSPSFGHIYDVNGIYFSVVQDLASEANGIIVGGMSRANKVRGAQIGLYTKNEVIRGVQIGIFNRSRENSQGLQIGLINISELMDGFQIGLINIAKNKKIKTLPIINFSL